jgi:hypothetical protein
MVPLFLLTIAWGRALLEVITVAQLVMKFSTFCWSPKFTEAINWTLSWTVWNQYTLSPPCMMHCNATLPFPIYTLVFPDFYSGYTTKYCIFSHSIYGSCSQYCLNVEIYILSVEDFYFECKDLLHLYLAFTVSWELLSLNADGCWIHWSN